LAFPVLVGLRGKKAAVDVPYFYLYPCRVGKGEAQVEVLGSRVGISYQHRLFGKHIGKGNGVGILHQSVLGNRFYPIEIGTGRKVAIVTDILHRTGGGVGGECFYTFPAKVPLSQKRK